MPTLEDQILDPVQHPDEMNLPWFQAVQRLQADEPGRDYPQLFFNAFGTDEVTPELTVKAVAQFVRTMVSSDSKFDLWRRGETSSPRRSTTATKFSARRGRPRSVPGGQFGGDCFHCHGEAGMQFTDNLMHNNGLDSVFAADPGFAGVTGNPLDSGKFRTPTLRNVALSAPYMHDGRFSRWNR